jgi:hypothetical protein
MFSRFLSMLLSPFVNDGQFIILKNVENLKRKKVDFRKS